MVEMNIEEIKKSELKTLNMLDAVCKKFNLRYYLFAGTLLGAVRHKGFIPWDDDIDVAMPREDYNKLVELSKHKDFGFDLLSFEATKGYKYPFGKACDRNTVLVEDNRPNCEMGVYVDVFPLDTLPADRNKAYKFANKFCYYFWLIYMSANDKYEKASSLKADIVKRLIYPISKLVGCAKWNEKAVKEAQKYSNCDSSYTSILLAPLRKPLILEKKWFEECVMLPFEGEQYPAPIGYHELLTTNYGDYMKLPPESERVAHHFFEAHYKVD